MSKLLEGKTAIITGAGGKKGIGRAIALKFAEEGAKVVVNDFGTMPDGTKFAEITATDIISSGGTAVANWDSVTSMEGAQNIIQTCVNHFGKVDILVNCAGNHIMGDVFEASERDFDSMINLHLKGQFFCAQTAAKQMVEQGCGGAIINFASQSSFLPAGSDGHQVLYGTVKAGVLGLTTHMAYGLKKYNIRVNDILPDAESKLNTDPSRNTGMGDGMLLPVSPRKPEYIASILTFLVSDLAKDVTGKHIYIGGADFCIYAPILSLKEEHSRFFRNENKLPWEPEELAKIEWNTMD